MIKIVVATDAWKPQVNGVVHTLERMSAAAREQGAAFEFVTPLGFATLPLPTYPDIRVALASVEGVADARACPAGGVLPPSRNEVEAHGRVTLGQETAGLRVQTWACEAPAAPSSSGTAFECR